MPRNDVNHPDDLPCIGSIDNPRHVTRAQRFVGILVFGDQLRHGEQAFHIPWRKGVMEMIVKGLGDPIDLGEQSKALASRRRELETKLPLIETNVVSLHPQAVLRYRRKVEEIQAALTAGDNAGQEAVGLVRSPHRQDRHNPTARADGIGGVW